MGRANSGGVIREQCLAEEALLLWVSEPGSVTACGSVVCFVDVLFLVRMLTKQNSGGL